MNNIQLSCTVNESLSTHYLIYKITNNINGKYYIGQHKTNDIYDDYMGSGKIILDAEDKYGLSAFIKTILFDFDNFDDMNNKEIELVQLSNCWPYDQLSYNLREGGNKKMSEETKIKLSQSIKAGGKVKGKNNPMYGRNDQTYGIIEFAKNRKGKSDIEIYGEEQAQKIAKKRSDSTKGKKKSEEHKKKISDSHIGINVLDSMTKDEIDAWKNKLSKSHKGKKKSEEHKKKIGAANKGKKRSEEFKQQMRELNTGRKHTPEELKKMSKSHKGKKKSKETREKMSKNNCMHGHSVTDFMTEIEQKCWLENISKAARDRKRMIHPITGHRIMPKKENCQKYLDLGYIYGNKIPTK